MARAKRQHYVPRLHLRHFTGVQPKGQVWTYDKETGEVRSGTPENTAVETHFYSAENDDGTLNIRIEEALARLEDKAAPIYERLISGHLPTADQEKAEFAMFVAIMYTRTPAVRRDAAEILGRGIQIMNYAYGVDDEAFEGLMRRFEEREGRQIRDKAKFREWLINPTKYTLQIRKESTFMALGAADKLAPLFFKMNWCIVRPCHGFFITSDNPVVRFVEPKTCHPIYGDHGFLNKTAEVTFPLDPHRLLMMAWQETPKDAVLPKHEHVWSMNKIRASHADRYLYSHARRREIRQLAVSLKDSRPILTTEGFGPKKFTKVEVLRRWPKRSQT